MDIGKYNNKYLTKVKYPPQQNFNTPIEEKFKDNKIYNKICCDFKLLERKCTEYNK